ncbi:MAG: hypothetical protein FWH28_04725 [Clostridiales bacterium]|nr:hypothetical protein [Clostridiales bacterium]
MSVTNAAESQRREAEGISDMRANADRARDRVPSNHLTKGAPLHLGYGRQPTLTGR